MILVALVGGGVGWIELRARARRHAVEAVVRGGGQVFAYHHDPARGPGRTRGPLPALSRFWKRYGDWSPDLAGVWLQRTPDPRVRLEALSTFTRLNQVYAPGVDLTGAELVAISKLRLLRVLDICGTGIDDAGLARLGGLDRLTSLNLAGNGITDAGLAHLGGLGRLAELNLSETDVTDAGVIHLVKLPALRSLTLHSTAVSGKGLRALGALPSLRWLEIHSESVGDEEIAELRRAFPSLRINTNPLR
jgi:hypothetical protein